MIVAAAMWAGLVGTAFAGNYFTVGDSGFPATTELRGAFAYVEVQQVPSVPADGSFSKAWVMINSGDSQGGYMQCGYMVKPDYVNYPVTFTEWTYGTGHGFNRSFYGGVPLGSTRHYYITDDADNRTTYRLYDNGTELGRLNESAIKSHWVPKMFSFFGETAPTATPYIPGSTGNHVSFTNLEYEKLDGTRPWAWAKQDYGSPHPYGVSTGSYAHYFDIWDTRR